MLEDPMSVTKWPQAPPLTILSERQSEDLGEYIARDAKCLEEVGFENLVAMRRQQSDFYPDVQKLRHKAARFLDHLRKRGANVALSTPPWDEERLDEMMDRPPPTNQPKSMQSFSEKSYWTLCRRDFAWCYLLQAPKEAQKTTTKFAD
jgi:hypothetical protein